MPDVSIAISARDNFSEALRKMAGTVTPFRKDLDLLQGELSTLNRTKTTLKVDLTTARREVQAAKKDFEKLATAQSRAAYEAAQSSYDNLTSDLRLVSRNARQAEKDMLSLSGTASKTRNKGGGVGAAVTSLGARLGQSGAIQLLGNAASEISGTVLQSALGQPIASALSTAISGAASGAAMGTMIGGPGVGTAIGAGAGALVGAVQGAAQVFSAKDDAFKSYTQEATENALQERKQTQVSGSAIAAGRETDLVSFSTLFGGEALAADYLEKMKTMANTTPFLYADLAGMSKTLKTFGYKTDEMLPKLTAVGDAGAALGMSPADMNIVATAMGRMKSSNKTSLEYINMLQERGIDAVGALAGAKGVSKGDIYSQISKGDIAGGDADAIITQFLREEYGGSMEQQAGTFAGLSSTLEGWTQEAQNAMGEGYNEGRKRGMQKQIDWMAGSGGQAMEDANRAMGAFQAELENSKEQYIRDAQDEMMKSAAFISAKNVTEDDTASPEAQQQAWADMGEMQARAKTRGISEYNASEGAQAALESELALAQHIKEDTSADSAFYDAGYRKSMEYGRGLASGIASANAAAIANGAQLPGATYARGGAAPAPAARTASSYAAAAGHAAGLPYVPRDNYPALLHEGERVLTANQARQQDAGAGSGVSVKVYGMTVREEADVAKVAAELARQISLARAAARPR